MQVGIHDPDAASSCANQDCSCSPESKSFNKGTIAAVHLDIHGHIFPSRAFVAVLPASHDASRSPTHQFLFAPLRSHREITTLGRLRCVRTSVLPCFPMRRGGLNLDLRLSLPSHEASISQFLTQSGTFKDGDLLVNKDGLRILSHSEEGGVIMKLPCKANLCSLSSFFVLGICYRAEHSRQRTQADCSGTQDKPVDPVPVRHCKFPYPRCDSFYELLDMIVEQAPPCAPPEHFSEEFCSFISECLQKKPKDRKTARLLLKHPFLSMYDDLQVDLASYFTVSGLPLSQFSKE
ncbi:hypothetical protein BHE74_00051860 [Ensete ventricosum]|nr:hypothetical protein BHE74_00051860 [Ensete ventricosum]